MRRVGADRFASVLRVPIVAAAVALGAGQFVPGDDSMWAPGRRVLLDAHNAYPYRGRWADRIDRALAAGLPLAIEQDLVWTCQGHGPCRSVVAHEEPYAGDEPPLRQHFFERVRPIVERALAAGDRSQWPLITLNLDFKTNEPDHHAWVWSLLGEYEAWLTTAPRTASAGEVAPLAVGPLLVLTGSPDAQELSFHDRVPVGARLRVFGAVVSAADGGGTQNGARAADPADVYPGPRTNYRRWWNNAWSAVEAGGPREAGAWTEDDGRRLRTLVSRAHDAGLWIRFYTLNGVGGGEPSLGWDEHYDFGSIEAVASRWRAAIDAGVDFVATDQYEAFAAVRQSAVKTTAPH